EFIEVHVATSLAECERRDTKGLYKKVRAGELHGVSGVDAPYEAPTSPDLVVGMSGESVTESVRRVVEQLRQSGVLGSRGN
ncbi:MAG: adenylyl-sulfate kinase, partial [Actinomycetota bacterium]